MTAESCFALKTAEIETIAAAGIENRVVDSRSQYLPDSAKQGSSHSPIMQTPSRCNSLRRIARMLGPPLLRLQQIDISAAGDVERMPASANHSPILARKADTAPAHGTKEHSTSVTNAEPA
jgi:hypothetical protein